MFLNVVSVAVAVVVAVVVVVVVVVVVCSCSSSYCSCCCCCYCYCSCCSSGWCNFFVVVVISVLDVVFFVTIVSGVFFGVVA